MEVNSSLEKKNKTISVSFTLNGYSTMIQTQPAARVVDLLRDNLNMTGTKLACGIGRCGACSILVNGKIMSSCLLLAYQIEHTSVTTIEGLSKQSPHPIQQAFLEEGGFQCGYCTPGMVMAVKCLLDSKKNPAREEIQEALSGNLCRCTGYSSIIRSVERAIQLGSAPDK